MQKYAKTWKCVRKYGVKINIWGETYNFFEKFVEVKAILLKQQFHKWHLRSHFSHATF